MCDGSCNVLLGNDGPVHVREVVAALLALGPITQLFRSGLAWCVAVANAVAVLSDVPPVADARLQERSFGAWESRPWDDIHAETGDATLGMVTAPGTWRPPDGETTFELRDRALAWHADLPADGRVVAVTRGGHIAALVGTLLQLPVAEWPRMIPRCGAVVLLEPGG